MGASNNDPQPDEGFLLFLNKLARQSSGEYPESWEYPL